MFPEKELFQYVLLDLDECRADHDVPAQVSMPCDRWLARSCLQKAIRRGEVEIAQRALARLLADHPQSLWRHLVTIAIEDVGVADIDLVARVIAAGRDRSWRARSGGEWAVASLLVRQMAEADHCQSGCDLMLVGLYRPAYDQCRADALDASADTLAAMLADPLQPIVERGIAAMALGGVLADGQRCHDPHAVFDIMAEQGHFSHVVATGRAAWRATRDPMALMLPITWQARTVTVRLKTVDDRLPPAVMLNGVPDYSLDQHTRAGSEVAQALLKADPDLRAMLKSAGIAPIKMPRTVGNLLFLIDGSLIVRRLRWQIGDSLRLPYRAMPEAEQLGDGIDEALAHLRRQAPVIADLRQHIFLRSATNLG